MRGLVGLVASCMVVAVLLPLPAAGSGDGVDPPSAFAVVAKPGRAVASWRAPIDNGEDGDWVRYFSLYRCDAPCGRPSLVGNVGSWVLLFTDRVQFTDSTAPVGSSACYFATATTDSGETPATPTICVTPLPLPDPAVSSLRVDKPVLVTDHTAPMVNPIRSFDVSFVLANDASGATEATVPLVLSACPKAGEFATPSMLRTCERIATWDVLLGAGQTLAVSALWEIRGDLGDYEVCAWAQYAYPQTAVANDRRCVEAFVLVGGTGAGGAHVV
ncbi:MAG: hypothetical protein ACT4PT_08090 [Methanobacteriota archaeon]